MKDVVTKREREGYKGRGEGGRTQRMREEEHTQKKRVGKWRGRMGGGGGGGQDKKRGREWKQRER